MSRTEFDRRDLAAIAVGGVLGATLRWWITDVSTATNGGWFVYTPGPPTAIRESVLPWRTLAVNLLGTLLLGAALTLRKGSRGTQRAWLALAAGFCGSLTTFSTLAVELANRFRNPSGNLTMGTDLEGFEPVNPPTVVVEYGDLTPLASGLLYLAVSLLGAVAAFWIGRRLARMVVA